MFVRAIGGFALARWLTRRRVRILCYHGIWLGDDRFEGDWMFMLPETFRKRLELLQRRGYPVVTLSDAVAALEGRGRVPDGAVVITIDDGWYSVYSEMVPALREVGFPATLYVATRYVESQSPVPQVMARYLRKLHEGDSLDPRTEELYATATDSRTSIGMRLEALELLAGELGIEFDDYVDRRMFGYMNAPELLDATEAGIDVQLHTHNHSMRGFDPAGLTDEISSNRMALARMLNSDPTRFRHFCYPSGRHARGLDETLRRLGIASATTTKRGLASRGDSSFFLPRVMDGDNLSQLEFEAELSGILEIARIIRDMLRRRETRPDE